MNDYPYDPAKNIDPGQDPDDLIRRAEIKAGMMAMGEPITHGSDVKIIGELVARIRELEGQIDVERSTYEDVLRDNRRKAALRALADKGEG